MRSKQLPSSNEWHDALSVIEICLPAVSAGSSCRKPRSWTAQVETRRSDRFPFRRFCAFAVASSDQSCHIFGKENAFLVLQAQKFTPAAPGPAARLPRAATSSHIGSAAQYAAARIADPTLDAHPRQHPSGRANLLVRCATRTTVQYSVLYSIDDI